MQFYFSPSTRGFYNEEVHGTNIPSDGIAITKQHWQTLLEQQGTIPNASIEVVDGVVCVISKAPTDEERAASLRFQRDSLLSATDKYVVCYRDQLEAGVTTSLTREQYADLQQYRMALRNLPEQAGFPHDVAWPTNPLGTP